MNYTNTIRPTNIATKELTVVEYRANPIFDKESGS